MSAAQTDITTRLAELDGLRGVAILLVIFFHYIYGVPGFAPGTIGAYIMLPFIRLGWSGVDLFFVLSGYLVTSITLGNSASPRFFRYFLMRRCARILPVYVVVISGLFVGHLWFSESAPRLFRDIGYWWSYLVFMQNDAYAFKPVLNFASVSWSVAIEAKFYLLGPALMLFLVRRSGSGDTVTLAAVLAAIVLVTPAIRAASPVSDREAWGYLATVCRLDAMSVGALVAIIARNGWGIPRWWIVAPAVAISAMLLPELKQKGFWGPFTLTILALFYGSILLLVVRCTPVVTNLLRLRPLRYCGTISYGLYFYHIPMLGLATAILFNADYDYHSLRPMSVTVIALVGSFLLAHCSWRYFEQPLLLWVHERSPYGVRRSEASPPVPVSAVGRVLIR